MSISVLNLAFSRSTGDIGDILIPGVFLSTKWQSLHCLVNLFILSEVMKYTTSIKVIPICFVKLRFNALERAKRGMSEIMCGSDFTAL